MDETLQQGAGELFFDVPHNHRPTNSPPRWSYPSSPMPPRPLDPGIGMAVARRTVFRESDHEDWGRVADRVADGNCSLLTLAGLPPDPVERGALRNAIALSALPTSGRHLQHGDAGQISRNETVYTNCSTAASSFMLFLLLLHGSGVGRSYDDSMMFVDWGHAPDLLMVLPPSHPDWSPNLPLELGLDKFPAASNPPVLLHAVPPLDSDSLLFVIPDSRDGWGQSLEIWEAAAFAGQYKRLVLDFSLIRPAGAPIMGMQGRPASGPVSLMRAFAGAFRNVVAASRCAPMQLWEQALRLDHEFSVEVQVGGARRSARMSTKYWRDPEIEKFIRIKNESSLWTSNNSVIVDSEFWRDARIPGTRASDIFLAATESAYHTGEPGFINGDKLEDEVRGLARAIPPRVPTGTAAYAPTWGLPLLKQALHAANLSKYCHITNPCGEISLHSCGGFCVIADVAPVMACPIPFESVRPGGADALTIEQWDARVEDAVRLAVRFLMRANLMDSIYREEVQRTNRIGVGLTGVHEWAWLRWGFGFRDLLDESRAAPFWQFVGHLSALAKQESVSYATRLGTRPPFTVTTAKPSGTISKMTNITEGIHLPARRGYIRWVQFKGVLRNPGLDPALPESWDVGSDVLLPELIGRGYPWRALKTFPGMTIIGFPTRPVITTLGMGNKLVTASEATPAEQYQWIRLMEKYWIGKSRGNQLSYTLKLYTNQHSLDDFRSVVLQNQPTVKCCSILPSKPESEMPYEYLPEEPVAEETLAEIESRIKTPAQQDIDMEELRCASGICPI